MILKLFPLETSRYKVQLKPINDNIGQCVRQSTELFLCKCKTNYRIAVNKYLKEDLERIVYLRINTTRRDEKKSNFFTVILLLKYYPCTAPLFLSYLLYKYEIIVPSIEELRINAETDSNLDTSTDDLILGGLIDNRGNIYRLENSMFQELMEKIKCNNCNLQKFGYDNFCHFSPVIFGMSLALLLFYIFKKN